MPVMKPIQSLITTGVAAIFLATATGCAPKLRALPTDKQVRIEKDRGILELRENISVAAVAVGFPPLSTGREFYAFGVEVQNHGDATLMVDPARTRLGRRAGDTWIDQSASLPDDLIRAYSASADASGSLRFHEITSPELARYCGPPPCYRPVYVYHGDVWVHGSYNDGAVEAYRRRQETASFLARLLRSQWVPKDNVAGGFLVFAVPIQKKEQYRLTIGISPTAPGTTQPVLMQDMIFEFYFEGK